MLNRHMTKTQTTNANVAAVVLSLSGRVGFVPARVSGNRVYLRTPGAVFNAVDQIRRAGLDARAVLDGQWHIEVA